MLDINLLPWREMAEKNRIKKFLYCLVVFCFLVLSICGVFYMKVIIELFEIEKEVKEMAGEASLYNDKSEVAEKGVIFAKVARDGIEFIEKKISDNSFMLELLELLGRDVPEEIYLNKIEKRGSIIYIYGRAFSQSAVVVLVDKLGGFFSHKKIAMNEVERVEGEDYSVKFIVDVK